MAAATVRMPATRTIGRRGPAASDSCARCAARLRRVGGDKGPIPNCFKARNTRVMRIGSTALPARGVENAHPARRRGRRGAPQCVGPAPARSRRPGSFPCPQLRVEQRAGRIIDDGNQRSPTSSGSSASHGCHCHPCAAARQHARGSRRRRWRPRGRRFGNSPGRQRACFATTNHNSAARSRENAGH